VLKKIEILSQYKDFMDKHVLINLRSFGRAIREHTESMRILISEQERQLVFLSEKTKGCSSNYQGGNEIARKLSVKIAELRDKLNYTISAIDPKNFTFVSDKRKEDINRILLQAKELQGKVNDMRETVLAAKTCKSDGGHSFESVTPYKVKMILEIV